MDVLIQALINTAVAHHHYEAHSSGTSSSKPEDGPMVQNPVKNIKGCIFTSGQIRKKKSCNGHQLWAQLEKSF